MFSFDAIDSVGEGKGFDPFRWLSFFVCRILGTNRLKNCLLEITYYLCHVDINALLPLSITYDITEISSEFYGEFSVLRLERKTIYLI